MSLNQESQRTFLLDFLSKFLSSSRPQPPFISPWASCIGSGPSGCGAQRGYTAPGYKDPPLVPGAMYPRHVVTLPWTIHIYPDISPIISTSFIIIPHFTGDPIVTKLNLLFETERTCHDFRFLLLDKRTWQEGVYFLLDMLCPRFPRIWAGNPVSPASRKILHLEANLHHAKWLAATTAYWAN